MNYSNGTDPFLEVEAEVRDQGRGNALWVRQQLGSLESLIPLPTAGLGFESSSTLHVFKKENTKHSRRHKNRCVSITRPYFQHAAAYLPPIPFVPHVTETRKLCYMLTSNLPVMAELLGNCRLYYKLLLFK